MTNTSIQENSNNDLFIGSDGNLAIATGVFAVQQDAEAAMQSQLGEMIYQPNDGLPNLTDIWLQLDAAKWEAAARKRLSGVNGVTNIVSIIYSVVDETFSYVATFNTVYSQQLTINGNITGAPVT